VSEPSRADAGFLAVEASQAAEKRAFGSLRRAMGLRALFDACQALKM
jgi:hypothetical protein